MHTTAALPIAFALASPLAHVPDGLALQDHGTGVKMLSLDNAKKLAGRAAAIDDLIAYLASMKTRKIDPKAAAK